MRGGKGRRGERRRSPDRRRRRSPERRRRRSPERRRRSPERRRRNGGEERRRWSGGEERRRWSGGEVEWRRCAQPYIRHTNGAPWAGALLVTFFFTFLTYFEF